MFLSEKLYGELQDTWLYQRIPQQIARRIEQDYDIGGWTTF